MKRLALITSTVVLAACAQPESLPPPQGIGMANPASVYCVEKGGTLAIQQTATGQLGMCTLPDGMVIEEWALFRRDHAPR